MAAITFTRPAFIQPAHQNVFRPPSEEKIEDAAVQAFKKFATIYSYFKRALGISKHFYKAYFTAVRDIIHIDEKKEMERLIAKFGLPSFVNSLLDLKAFSYCFSKIYKCFDTNDQEGFTLWSIDTSLLFADLIYSIDTFMKSMKHLYETRTFELMKRIAGPACTFMLYVGALRKSYTIFKIQELQSEKLFNLQKSDNVEVEFRNFLKKHFELSYQDICTAKKYAAPYEANGTAGSYFKCAIEKTEKGKVSAFQRKLDEKVSKQFLKIHKDLQKGKTVSLKRMVQVIENAKTVAYRKTVMKTAELASRIIGTLALQVLVGTQLYVVLGLAAVFRFNLSLYSQFALHSGIETPKDPIPELVTG